MHNTVRTLALTLGMTFAASAAAPPVLPQTWIDTKLPAQSGTILQVGADCRDLQAKIDAAVPGDTVVIPQGAVCVGNYALRKKPAGTGWIVIQGSASASLPVPGNRIGPSAAPLLPKIVSPNTSPAIRTDAGAHHYRLIGLEITVAPAASFIYDLVTLGNGGAVQNALSLVPANIIVDRCYIHGNPNQTVKRGVALNSASTAVVDSYVSDIHAPAQDTQALCGWNGPGPFKIVNNYLEAAGENIMFGGAPASITGLVPSDIELRGNRLTKRLSWRIGDPTYGGNRWWVKNLLEIKNARRVLIDGNILEYSWKDAQSGTAVLFTVRTQSGTMPWAAVEDVTFTRNTVRHAAGGFTITSRDDNGMGVGQRFLIQDNIFEDISSAWGGSGWLFVPANGPDDLKWNHNTTLQSSFAMFADGSRPGSRFEFTNNISFSDLAGSGFTPNQPALDHYFPGAVVTKNVFVAGRYKVPPDNSAAPSWSAVGFLNLAAGDYHLGSTSPYRGTATDGRDPGADVDAVRQAAAGASNGVAPPAVGWTPTPPCTVSYSATMSFGVNGGTGTIKVDAPAGCPWTAQSNVPSIVLSSRSGTGSGSVSVSIKPDILSVQ